MAEPAPRSTKVLVIAALAALVFGTGLGWAFAAHRFDSAGQSADFEQRVHDYIVSHPEVLSKPLTS